MRAIATGHSELLPWIVRDIEFDKISKEDMKYSEMGQYWMKHPKYKELDRCLGDTRPDTYSSTSKNDDLKSSLCGFLEENSDLETRVRSEIEVLGQLKRKRYLRKPFWILLRQYKDEKMPECSLSTLRRIYQEHFSCWLSLPDDESILRCVCPSHLQVELFCKAINRVSLRPAISEEQLLDTTVCENSGHAYKCLENHCTDCDDSEDGYALARARLELLIEEVPDDADITYAYLCEIERVDSNNNKYKREQILMQSAPKSEFLDLLTDYLLRGCMSSGAQKKLLNHYKLNSECYNFSKSLLDTCTYDSDALVIITDYAMGVSAREIQETQTMHFRKDVFPLLSDISYGKCPDGKPRKIYTHLLAEVRTPKDPLFSLAGIKMSLERAYQLYGPKKNLYVQSDGAESQFWSAEMFYTLPRFFNSLDDRFDFETIVWFKTVSGHGKGEIDSSHGCVKRDLTNLYNNLGRNDLNGDGLDVIGLVDSADGLVNYLNNDMKCHFGELESEKMDSRGFYLSGRYISEFKRDPGLRTSDTFCERVLDRKEEKNNTCPEENCHMPSSLHWINIYLKL
ncbi:Oidioi.mRNA.OKI2018_I69.XSR.g14767.t1.cds [Oikopleura dioica]|uniref:Oidioi.mRNA.OKI2018_I69.XSR.g14767.t1.cds n=1 Tax=Oikopleura dioica TaxID=34765 RepID=A0ABN7SFR8_OIKDI|nr:Oidioi.mRNA.OKI2018_I69.XSR.g14767.t1.cds [Oikopleura dioica]